MQISHILVGTGNENKFAEISLILAKLGVRAISPADVGVSCGVEENGKSYEENAALKAKAFSKSAGLFCMADDSGLEVDALSGAPGVYSARFAGEDGNYAANNRKMLKKLEGVPPGKRSARFVCAIVLADKDDILLSCRGTCEGIIVSTPRGDDGFGYDPLFEYYGKTFAEMGEEKHRISHRANALSKFCEEFKQLCAVSLSRE